MKYLLWLLLLWLGTQGLWGCTERPGVEPAALRDPVLCQSCHPDHYREWAGSMHAYASDDPVFVALNELGQRQTEGALGSFCINCHAPVAARLGASTDGRNLKQLPRDLKGVTCWFCHSIEAVTGDHNGAVALATDGVMRGGIGDPVFTPAHRSAHSPHLDGRDPASSHACGACHDVVTPSGLHLERTYAEWKQSVFNQPAPGGLGCIGCHMPTRAAPASAEPGAPRRRVHDHQFPGVDTALQPWPEQQAQRLAIQRDLDSVVGAQLCVTLSPPGVQVKVVLDNVMAGHAFPSGVTHARRAWVELKASAGGEVRFETGHVPPGASVLSAAGPDPWVMRTRLLLPDGGETHQSWQATQLEESLLPPAVTSDPSDPRYNHARQKSWSLDFFPEEVEMAVRIRPIDRELLHELEAAGLLEAGLMEKVPTFTLEGTRLRWRAGDPFGCVQ